MEGERDRVRESLIYIHRERDKERVEMKGSLFTSNADLTRGSVLVCHKKELWLKPNLLQIPLSAVWV